MNASKSTEFETVVLRVANVIVSACNADAARAPCAAVAYAVLLVTAAEPKPRVVRAAEALASSIRVPPNVLTSDAGSALVAKVPCAAVA